MILRTLPHWLPEAILNMNSHSKEKITFGGAVCNSNNLNIQDLYNTIANTIHLNYRSILNYFINRSANASTESFNTKIKAFRAQFRGVKNVEFLLYRLTTIFA